MNEWGAHYTLGDLQSEFRHWHVGQSASGRCWASRPGSDGESPAYVEGRNPLELRRAITDAQRLEGIRAMWLATRLLAPRRCPRCRCASAGAPSRAVTQCHGTATICQNPGHTLTDSLPYPAVCCMSASAHVTTSPDPGGPPPNNGD